MYERPGESAAIAVALVARACIALYCAMALPLRSRPMRFECLDGRALLRVVVWLKCVVCAAVALACNVACLWNNAVTWWWWLCMALSKV